MNRTRALPVFLLLSVSFLLTANDARAEGLGGRLYLGPAAGEGQSQGNGAVLGFMSAGGAEVLQGYWGLQLLGVQIGTGNAFLPLVSVDGGFLWSPFPKGFLRPHANLGIGATFLLILPLPALTFGLGVGIPIGDLFVLDLNVASRATLNPFDGTNNPASSPSSSASRNRARPGRRRGFRGVYLPLGEGRRTREAWAVDVRCEAFDRRV